MFAEIDQKNSKIAYIETKLNEQIAFLNVKIQEKSNEINFERDGKFKFTGAILLKPQ